jgi:outer membrane protein insertion porin family
MAVPIYQLTTPGGDTQTVANFEYRIPILGPVSMAPFMDVGMNRILYKNQLRMNPDRITQLNSLFPQAAFNGKIDIVPGTQNVRMSAGLEIQVLLPVVNAPFRVYYAFNPLRVYENIQTPLAVDRSYFPNLATYLNYIQNYGINYPFHEKRGTFRFTIGRTF